MVKNRYSIKFTSIAMNDLEEIYRYISEELCAEDAAADLLNRIESNIMRVSRFPYSGSYPSDEFKKQVVIMRILHGKCKFEDLL